MLNLKQITTLAVVIMVLLAGCKKNSTSVAVSKIASTKWSGYGSGPITNKYTYDTQGRPIVTQTYDSLGVLTAKTTYTYGNNSVTVAQFDSSNNTPNQQYTYSLNAQGYITGCSAIGVSCTYNSNGDILSYASPYLNDSYTYTGGNNTGDTWYVITYTSRPESRPYSFGLALINYINPDYALFSLAGKNNVNLPAMNVDNYVGQLDTTFYTYQFDGQGRVITETLSYPRSAPYQTTEFTYVQ